MNNKKVMICQLMYGKTNEQIKKERQQIVDKLENMQFDVLDTIIEEDAPKNCNESVWYLSKSLELLSKADIVVFMSGWSKGKGCRAEHEICILYNIPIIYEYEL